MTGSRTRAPRTSPRSLAILALVGAVLTACGGSTTPAASHSTAPAASPTYPATLPPTAGPTAGGRLPDSEHLVEPGRYTWDEFTPHIVLDIGAGWQVGHRHPEFFDLFPADSEPTAGPGIGFGRFDFVHGPDGPVPMTDAAAVVAALEANPLVILRRVGPASLAGLTGLIVDLRVTEQQTPLLDGRGGTFHADPGWVGRYHFLDVEGGVLAVSVLAHDNQQADGLALAAPLLASLRLAP